MERLLILLAVVFLFSCCREKPQFVYKDLQDVIHASQGCKAVTKVYNAQPVTPIPTTELRSSMLGKVCSQCVDEATLKELREIGEANDSTKRQSKFN